MFEIVPSFPVLVAFSLAAALLIITPGPDMTLFLAKTLAQGRRAGLAAVLGASGGILVHTALAAFGLSALLAASATAFGAVKLVGAFYLLWLAYDTVRHGSALNLDPKAGARQNLPLSRVFLMGVGINLLNPKIVLFFITFLPQFVAADDPNAATRMVFLGAYFVVLAAPACGFMVLMADRISDLARRSPKVLRIIDWSFAGVFAAFALSLLFERVRD
ncbi:MAG: LysE family translocator [Alphaproteobacteria bacterium]